jgi:hypothetical protein
MTASIRPYIPFKVVYFESFEKEPEAIAREKYCSDWLQILVPDPTEVVQGGFQARLLKRLFIGNKQSRNPYQM